VRARQRRATFVTGKVLKRMTESIDKSGEEEGVLDIASSVDTEVLMTSYIEDNTFQGKNYIFNSASTVHVCS